MCYRTKLNSRLRDIEETFEATFIDPHAYTPQEEINGFTHQETPVILDENPEEIDFFQWGLIPFWARDKKLQKNTLNAKIETVKEKPSFRDVVNNRCLIIADGFYEWQWLDSKGTKKQKYLIQPKDHPIFAFAGIYSSWRDPATEKLYHTYSILTTEANRLMSEIHNTQKRMPVVLQEQDQKKWLRGKEVSEFAFPYEADLTAIPADKTENQQLLNF